MESSNRNDMPVFMDNDLDPYTLVHDIVSNWWVIILGAIAGALLTYVVVSSRYVPEYTTQATFVVSSRGDANAYSNLSSANTMAKTFEKILKSNIMEKKICEKLKVEELDADIHAKVLEGTNMLVLSVTADTPKESIDIIRTVMDNYSSVSLYTVAVRLWMCWRSRRFRIHRIIRWMQQTGQEGRTCGRSTGAHPPRNVLLYEEYY